MRKKMNENCVNLERRRKLRIDRKRPRVRLAFHVFAARTRALLHLCSRDNGAIFPRCQENFAIRRAKYARSFPRYFLRTICTARWHAVNGRVPLYRACAVCVKESVCYAKPRESRGKNAQITMKIVSTTCVLRSFSRFPANEPFP